MGKWFAESFGRDYLAVYKHRDFQGAYREVKRMIDWLHLPQGAEVLDLCCGTGRHSLALADFGFKVTGVDLSDALLAEARKSDKRGRVVWVKGDMRQVPLQREFEAVVNLFTSFGYFAEDAENARVLEEMSRLLMPGGKFMIDYLNPEYVTAHLVPRSERTEGPLRIEERRSIENGFVKKCITIRQGNSPERRHSERVKLYRLADFAGLMRRTRLAIDLVYGNYTGETFDPKTSKRMIMIGHKAENGKQ